MTNTKIELKLGDVSFSGEGSEKWVAAQLDKILDKAPELVRRQPSKANAGKDAAESVGTADEEPVGTLAGFFQKCGKTTNQARRFLAAAEWLRRRGTQQPATADVTAALRENHQPKLGNPADCLNKNVKKGYCEKVGGNKFFVTPEGRASLS